MPWQQGTGTHFPLDEVLTRPAKRGLVLIQDGCHLIEDQRSDAWDHLNHWHVSFLPHKPAGAHHSAAATHCITEDDPSCPYARKICTHLTPWHRALTLPHAHMQVLKLQRRTGILILGFGGLIKGCSSHHPTRAGLPAGVEPATSNIHELLTSLEQPGPEQLCSVRVLIAAAAAQAQLSQLLTRDGHTLPLGGGCTSTELSSR